MRRILLFSFFIIYVGISCAVAQPRFASEQGLLSYRGNEMLINPAYTGLASDVSMLSLLARNQWMGMDKSPKAQNLQFQTAFSNVGLGGWFYHESYGVTNNLQLSLSYAYKLKFDSSTLALGLQGGVLSTGEGLVMRLNSEDDPIFATAPPRRWAYNTGFGAHFHTESYYVGFSIPQLLSNVWEEWPVDKRTGLASSTYQPNISSKLDFSALQYYLTAGYVLELTDDIHFIPTGLLQYSQNTSLGYELMLYGVYDRQYRVGLGYGSQSAIRAELQVAFAGMFNAGYRFERSLGSAHKHLPASHQLLLSFVFGKAWSDKRDIPLF